MICRYKSACAVLVSGACIPSVRSTWANIPVDYTVQKELGNLIIQKTTIVCFLIAT